MKDDNISSNMKTTFCLIVSFCNEKLFIVLKIVFERSVSFMLNTAMLTDLRISPQLSKMCIHVQNGPMIEFFIFN